MKKVDRVQLVSSTITETLTTRCSYLHVKIFEISVYLERKIQGGNRINKSGGVAFCRRTLLECLDATFTPPLDTLLLPCHRLSPFLLASLGSLKVLPCLIIVGGQKHENANGPISSCLSDQHTGLALGLRKLGT